ncbi:hypothetical protein [Pseudanabaena sp. FACHB-2040]|uniref:hypothetical protein n=1 Tax=Pseudanabaena sp. FACHB-2040 TaxID=2692859 RepID=UPI0016898263|nr:hypothetical protein [Pseudanabaena sp. FACHB-2040]MBD2256633.1 hypothetical protein [Pseudanabaena sp. FACHB-2040]
MTPPTTRIKVTIQLETKAALEAVAARYGISLSHLIVSAAVGRHLMPKQETADLEAVMEYLRRLEAQVENLQEFIKQTPLRPHPQTEKPKKKRWGPKLGVTGSAKSEPVLDTESPSVVVSPIQAIEEGLPVHIDHLIDRFNGDKVLKARLCQLGGRKGDLFKGSITHAQKVEAVTRELDPEGLPWFPTSPDRDFWVQTSSVVFVRKVLTKDL